MTTAAKITTRHSRVGYLLTVLLATFCVSGLLAQHGHGSEGVGKVHMETSCAPAVSAQFDRALALLHNFWYARALAQFQDLQKADPECAMAYWGAAMTYNHPLWDEPSRDDEAAAWAFVQKGLKASKQDDREHMYLLAAAALYKDAGAGTKQSRDEGYRDRMAATALKYPDDETKLFYGLSIIGTIREGTKGFEMQGKAVKLFESVYAHDQQHPGVLHYLIHAYDDPVHAAQGLAAARTYAKTAAAVPHAYHMPSHIFTRLGYWEEAARTNENAWQISNDDVKEAGESGELRDFHSLNYLSYNYLQLGRYADAKKALDLFAAQYAMTNRKTAPDSQDLQARHVRGRTIFALPDRVLYGYFDTLARFIVESESWKDVPTLPLVAPSSDFVVMKLHLEATAAASRKDVATAKAKAAEMMMRASVAGQHPFVQQILTMQAREAAAAAALAAGDGNSAIAEMDAAVAIEDAIDSLSQPPYPIIPAHELYGKMLMQMGKPAEARRHFEETLRRTPGRPKAIAGIAMAAEAQGDTATARAQYTLLLELWKGADANRPELQAARRFLKNP